MYAYVRIFFQNAGIMPESHRKIYKQGYRETQPMSIFGLFGSKKVSAPGSDGTGEEDPEEVELREARKRQTREKSELVRQRYMADLELARLETLARKEELQTQIELARMERQAALEERRAQLFGDDDSDEDGANPDTLLIRLFSQIVQAKQPVQPAPAYSPPTTDAPLPSVVSLTKEQIQQKWATLPSYIQDQARNMSDDQLRDWVINEIPNIDAHSVARVVQVVRGA